MNRSQTKRLKRQSYAYKTRRIEIIKSFIDKLIIFLITVGICIVVYYFIIYEYGSISNWWNQ